MNSGAAVLWKRGTQAWAVWQGHRCVAVVNHIHIFVRRLCGSCRSCEILFAKIQFRNADGYMGLILSPAVSDSPFIFSKRRTEKNSSNVRVEMKTTSTSIHGRRRLTIPWNYCNSEWHLTVFRLKFGIPNNPNAFFFSISSAHDDRKRNHSKFFVLFRVWFAFAVHFRTRAERKKERTIWLWPVVAKTALNRLFNKCST